MADARFEDAQEGPLRLMVHAAEDLQVVSSLLQDAVLPITEMRYDRKARRFVLLLNRFRWEDKLAAEAAKRDYERVRSLLVVEDVLSVKSHGIDRSDKEMILSLLSIRFEAGEEGMGVLELTLAGAGAISIAVEALDLRLEDVSRPYLAPSRQAPRHD